MKLLHSQILGQGAPLLILHGFLGMSDNWKTLGNRFALNYEVHLIDQRNHGRSFHDDEFNYEVLAEDLLNYVAHHKLDNIHLLGHSMGGKTAMFFAVSYPEKVQSLLVADIGPRFYSAHHQDILDGLNAIDFTKQTSRSAVDKKLEEHVPEFGVRQFLLKNVYRKTKEQLAFRFYLTALTESYDEVGVQLPSLTQYEGETLFLRGENSGYITNQDVDLITAHFPKAKVVTIDNAGHWLHAENPNDFYDAVIAFLSNHRETLK